MLRIRGSRAYQNSAKTSDVRILIGSAVPKDATQGAAGTLCMTIDALRDLGHDVHEIWAKDLGVRRIQHGNLYYLAELPRRYRDVVRARAGTGSFDVIQLSQPHAWLAAKDHRRRRAQGVFVNRSHGWEGLAYCVTQRWDTTEAAKPPWRRLASRGLRQLLQRSEDRVVRYSDGLVVTSLDDQDFLSQRYGLPPERVLALPPGMPQEYLQSPVLPMTPERVRRWLYVGQFAPIKGPEIVAAMVNRVFPNQPQLRMTWVTQGDYHEQVRRLIAPQLHDRVALSDWMTREELVGTYDTHGIFVFPSYYEGFAKSFLEAMGRGLCVVATAVDGMRQAIRDGENGFLAAVGDVERLADQAARLSQDPALAERISAAARATALTYTWKNSCQSLIRFYEQLLDGKQAAKASC
jgi:glycosyltransferase involved in cell wall biosynthesis